MSIDPLAALADTQEQLHRRLLELTPTSSPDLETAWRAVAQGYESAPASSTTREVDPGPAQYLVLVTCRDEQHQVELLTRLSGEGLEARALLS